MLSNPPRPALIFSSAAQALEAHEYALARQLFYTLIQEPDFRIGALQGMGSSYEREKKFASAEKWFRAALEIEGSARSYLRLAATLLGQEREEEALQILSMRLDDSTLLTREAKEWRDLREKAERARVFGQRPADERFRLGLRLLEKNLSDVRVAIEVLRLARDLGAQREVLPMVHQMLDVAPRDVNLRVTLASLLLQLEEFEAAEEQIHRIIENDRWNPHVPALLAELPTQGARST